MHRIIGLAGLALFGSHSGPATPLDGSYVVRSLNGRALPTELRVRAAAGDFRLVRLEQGVLRLRPDGKFTLHFRYYHQLVRRGDQPVSTPVVSDSETGTYTLAQGRITLTAAKKNGTRSRAPIVATIVGDEIRASYSLLRVGADDRVALVLRRDPRFW